MKGEEVNKKFVIAIVAVLVVAGIYFSFLFFRVFLSNSDPEARDIQREGAVGTLTTELNTYRNSNNAYPSSLKQLVPRFVERLPMDPKTQNDYEYQLLSNGDYKLCIHYETKPTSCIQSYFYHVTPTP